MIDSNVGGYNSGIIVSVVDVAADHLKLKLFNLLRLMQVYSVEQVGSDVIQLLLSSVVCILSCVHGVSVSDCLLTVYNVYMIIWYYEQFHLTCGRSNT